MPKRSSDTKPRVTLNISITEEEKTLFEEEAARSKVTVSAFITRATLNLIEAPRWGGQPLLPSSGFMVLPVGVDEHIYVPRNWTPADLRRAADVFEALGTTPAGDA